MKDLGGLHEVQIEDLVPRHIRGGDIHESHPVAWLQALMSFLVLLKEGNVGSAVLGFKGVDHLQLEDHPEGGDQLFLKLVQFRLVCPRVIHRPLGVSQ